jgi:hypothetical protein
MYVLIVSIISALLLGGVYISITGDVLESIVIGFLLFIAIDSALRAAMGKPSWMVMLKKKK